MKFSKIFDKNVSLMYTIKCHVFFQVGLHRIHEFQPRCSIADCLPFYTAMLNMLLIGSQNRWHKRDPGGTCQNFDRDAGPIFLGLKFGQILFFWVGKFSSYFFLGFAKFPLFFWSDKFPAIFWGVPIFVSHT